MYYWAKHRVVTVTIAVVALVTILSPSSFMYGRNLVRAIDEQVQETAQPVVEPVVNQDNQSQSEATVLAPESSPQPKVVICHATSSESNPYNRIVVNANAIGGHFEENGTPKAGHEQDLLFYDEEAQCPGPQGHTIQGTKWNDLNGNGQQDPGEPGIADVTITLSPHYVDEVAVNDALPLATTQTDANGAYAFNGLSDNVYDVCEVVPNGWHQTYPINDNNNCHRVNFVPAATSVAIYQKYDFGNQLNEVREPVCGNQIKEQGEQCDDGNTANGDGCSNQCQLETQTCTDQQSGWWGEYFNLPANHPDVGAGDIPHFPYDDNVHGDPLGGWAPWTADWYDAQYFRFSRVDSSLNFGDDFFPMDMLGEEVNPAWNNHDFFFAAHWRAKVTAPATANYSYHLRSDDDSWVYIDGVRFDDKDGIHPPATSGITEIPLTAGQHIIDVFYAERHPLGATMELTLDERLTVMPAPANCEQGPTCGNEIKERGEQCDDGNTANGDGCSNQCQLEKEQVCRQETGAGWWANYYNYSINHPDMELPGDQWPDDGHGNPLGTWDTDWYQPEYYRFSRVESNLNFGDNFFPLDPVAEEVTFGHEFHFGARFRAKVHADTTGNYSYHLRSDDDSWVYIDGALFDATPGVHPPQTSAITQVYLTAGDHVFDIFYAERHRLGASFEFTLDSELVITPAPADCPDTCHSPLDFNDGQGNSGPDGYLTLGDAVEFTQRYEQALGATSTSSNWDNTVDVRIDGVINAADYICAQPYYGNAGPYTCQLDCANICHNPLDYNSDYFITLDDGVTFTDYYMSHTATSSNDEEVHYLADLNSNGEVDYGDYLCAHEQLASSVYQCPIQCSPVCGDHKTQARLGEQCDDGNHENGDGCSSTCQNEGGGGGGPVCGNEVIEEGEQCDDGNTNNGDGCSSTCQNEGGTGGGPVCGNHDVEEGEQCDDGNNINDDGCSNQCTVNTPPPGGNGGGGGGGGGGFISSSVRLDLVKTVSSATTEPGQQLSYSLKVKNTGSQVGQNLKLTDTLPAGFTFVDGGTTTKTWEWPTIAVGQEYVVTYAVAVSANNTPGQYLNQAQATVTNGSSAFATATVSIRSPQVLGVDTEVPATPAPAPEKVKVLGFEKLPETSGGFGDFEVMAILGVVISGLALSLRTLKNA